MMNAEKRTFYCLLKHTSSNLSYYVLHVDRMTLEDTEVIKSDLVTIQC